MKINNAPLNDTRTIIDSFDGAEHKRTTKGRIGIISFNSQMLCKSLISKISPSGSTNILTWQQIVGEEKLSTLLPALKDAYQTKMNIRNREKSQEEGKPMHVMYDLHDGKMLYLLTQHSLYNRRYHPFLLCDCSRGAGVMNNNHQCRIIPDEEQQQ